MYCSEGFVTRECDKLVLCGKEFRAVGANCYYFNYMSDFMIDDVISDAAEMKLNVLRVWGFLNGTTSHHRWFKKYMQPELGVYDDSGFERLSYAISSAKKAGIRLIITLVNNWKDFGGMSQYMDWIGSTQHDEFYTHAQAKKAYKNYIHYVLHYVNSYTNLAFKDDPTIMAWGLANEPRTAGANGDTIVAWADEMSTFVKTLDSRHLVSLGDEGWFNRSSGPNWAYLGVNGVDWDRLIQLPALDYGTFHLWPKTWGFTDATGFGNQWIVDHVDTARRAHKPCMMQEYGYPADEADRVDVFTAWLNTAEENGISGTQLWMLSGADDTANADSEGLFPNWVPSGPRVIYPSPEATVIAEHAKKMKKWK